MDVAFSFPLYISDNDKKTGDSTEVSNNLYIREGLVSAERQRASMPPLLGLERFCVDVEG
jgi:hypothetical protein